MRSFLRPILGAAALASAVSAFPQPSPMSYPAARRDPLVETLHGVQVPDPYRWMENSDDPELKKWIEEQNALTRGYLDQIPERAAIERRFTKLWNFERFGVPDQRGGRYFWTKNDGLQNQDVLYWGASPGKGKVLLDPNKLSEDGTVALSGVAISDDGKFMAYSLSEGGSDWQTWRVRKIDTGLDLPDKIEWSKFSAASWTPDGRGFYYSRYDAPKAGAKLQGSNYFHKLYFHKVGTPQSRDALAYERKDQKEWGFGGTVTEDGRYLVISVWQGTQRENRIFYRDLRAKSARTIELLTKADAQYTFLGNDGPIFWFQTDRKAPLSRVIAIDVRKPEEANWKSLVAETKDKLESVSVVGGRLFASYLQDASSRVKVFRTTGKFERDVVLPGIGTASGFGGKQKDRETFFSFMSFGYPTTVFRYEVPTGKTKPVFKPKVDFDPDEFVTERVFYRNPKDGTRIPMFVSYKKGMKKDGSNPTYLYGYGGFNSAMTPFFSVSRLVWMEMGGISAVACIRGGSEYGTKWHDGGRLKNKQNCFDDFIAAGEYLIERKFTSTSKLAIAGGSNGGLLVGACLIQRPDLWGAALPDVGVLDMLRFHKFTIGWAWVSDYGDPEKKEDFSVALRYSPYHNVKAGATLPPTFVTTGDHDDRVVPLHSFKFSAALQHSQAGGAPILVRIETQAGHGAGKPTSKIIEESADRFAVCVKNLTITLPTGFRGG